MIRRSRGFKQVWVPLLGLLLAGLAIGVWIDSNRGDDEGRRGDPRTHVVGHRDHLSHAPFFDESLETGQDVTRACIACHEDAAHAMLGTSHFQWRGDEVVDPKSGRKTRIGKKNLINNFCIGVQGNWSSCTRCHAGYGWSDASFDFTNPENIDCLVCHDRSGSYVKGDAGLPRPEVDLQAAARSVGYPQRDNCGVCHHYGGGGLGVKHGDLDSTLDNPDAYDDVHMGRGGMLCVDCHGGDGHNIRGKSYGVSVRHDNGIGCTDCHAAEPHEDDRINSHTGGVACQSCHIPSYANQLPTKMTWDWSKAGDDSRQDDPHEYLKIKGEFEYEKAVTPEYYWFDLTVQRYFVGDEIAAQGPTDLNLPRGSRGDGKAQIWPFKVHRAKQPYDLVHRQLISPVTSGEGGYWREFDWDQALRLGAEQAGQPYSGQYGFAETRMYWPLSHMVLPKNKALQCRDCHEEGGRMDWHALGYDGDPMQAGGD